MRILTFAIISTTMSTALTMMGMLLPKRKSKMKKKSPYECGFDPMKSARLPFSFRFFLMAMLFLMFDLEMMLLFPMLSALKKKMSKLLTYACLFIIMLSGGLAYEWKQGGLEWAE